MKKLIVTKEDRFDINTIRPKIESIVDAFDRYLDEYPAKTTRTMHGIMGPIPMILDGARVRKEDAETLIGKAVRAHEMNEKTRGYISPNALQALETAINELLALCKEVPITAISKITERIRYNVYYARRKKSIEYLERTRSQFAEFLRERYVSDAELAKVWNEDGITFDTIRFPSLTNKEFIKANDIKKRDITEFRALPSVEQVMDEEDRNE
jgi:hypothetical protein